MVARELEVGSSGSVWGHPVKVTLLSLDEVCNESIINFLQKVEGISFYYTPKYCRFLRDLLGCEMDYLVALEGEDVTGLLPLMWYDGSLGRVINSLPFFGSNGGILALTNRAEAELWKAYHCLIREQKVAAATIISHPLRISKPPFPIDHTDQRIGQITQLDFSDETGLMRKVAGSTRRNIRKADRDGVRVIKDASALPILEAIHRENMEAIGGRTKPHRFFSMLPNYFESGEDFDLFVAERDGEIIAGLLVFYSGNTVEYFLPATRLAARPLQPSAALLRTAMLESAVKGFKLWNWGGTWLTQKGVLAFKRKWGASDFTYRYFIHIKNKEIYQQPPDRLAEAYPYFYVVPFAALGGDGVDHGEK